MGILGFKARKAKKLRAAYDAAHPKLSAETSYLADVGSLMERFTTKDLADEQKHEAIQKATDTRIALDQKFIAEQFPGFEIVDYVKATRHGKSGIKEKGAGFSVNAPLSGKQIEGLKDAHTNNFTHHLLHSPRKALTIIASTMLRAKNTASLVAPTDKETTIESISTNQRLTEDGVWASSAAYTATAGKGRGWQVFARFFTPFTLRNRTHESKAVDEDLRGIRKRSGDESTELHGGYINESKVSEEKLENQLREPQNFTAPSQAGEQKVKPIAPTISEQTEQEISSLSVEDKVASINQLIVNHLSQQEPARPTRLTDDNLHSGHLKPKEPAKRGTLWLFGHGGTFKKFFKSMFGLEYDFDYLTTKDIYVLKGPDGKLVYFSPPGAIKIGVDGEMKGTMQDHRGLEDRALVSSTFDRSELLGDYSKQLMAEVDALKKEIQLAPLVDDSQVDRINALKEKLATITDKIGILEKHIKIFSEELSLAEKKPTKTAGYVNAIESVKLIKATLGKMQDTLGRLSAEEKSSPAPVAASSTEEKKQEAPSEDKTSQTSFTAGNRS